MRINIHHLKTINSIFLFVLFSNMIILCILIEPITIRNTISKESDDNNFDQFLPQYQDNHIIELGTWKEKLGKIDNIIISDSYAYVTGGDNHLAIINISNIEYPEIISFLDTDAPFSNHIQLYDDYLIVSQGARGFETFDISNKSNPIYVGYVLRPTTQMTIMYNQYLIVADMDVDLRIYDAQNFSSLNQISITYDGTQGAYDIDIKDHYAFVADGYEGLEIFDIQDVYNPVEVGNYTLTNGSYFEEIVIDNEVAYVLDNYNNLLLFNISDVENPVLTDKYNGAMYQKLVVENEIAYVIGSNMGIDILNCSNPTNITSILNFDPSGDLRDIQIVDDIIYLADKTNGFEVLNATNFSNITIITQYGSGNFSKMVYDNGYAYLLDYLGYLVVLNASDTNNIRKITSFYFHDYTYGLFVQEDLIFITTMNSGLYILNNTEKTSLELIGSYHDGGNATDVYVVGDRAYVIDILDGLEIIDISNLSSLYNVSTVYLPSIPTSLTVDSELAYITTNEDCFYTVNINEISPYFTRLVIFCLRSGYTESLVVDDLCFIASGALDILLITPERIDVIDFVEEGTTNDLAIINDYLLLTSGGTSIQIFDFSYPSTTYLIASFFDDGIIEDIFYHDGFVFFLNSENKYDFEITVFDSDGDELFDYEELQIYGTNPFNFDSDYDTLSDSDELFVYYTNPLSRDTDLDGLEDAAEIFQHGTDPNKKDTDGDGFSDLEEIHEGTNPLNSLSFPINRDWLIYVVVIGAFVLISGFLILRIRKNIK